MSEAFEFYRQFMQEDSLIFDIGANVGCRTELFSRLAGRVIAVEPMEAIYAVLWTVFQFNEKVVPVKKACGSGFEPPYAKIMEYDSKYPLAGISSMSPEWIKAVRETNRFHNDKEKHWQKVYEVEVTTLDKLIEEYGLPSFIKIDTEGYERQVLAGLSQKVAGLSFEFTPERLVDTHAAINACVALGAVEFALSVKESFELSEWNSASAVKSLLLQFAGDAVAYGDVYVRF